MRFASSSSYKNNNNKQNPGLHISKLIHMNDGIALLEEVHASDFNLTKVYNTFKANTEPLLHYAARTGRKKLLEAVLSKMDPIEEGEVDHLLNTRFRGRTALDAAKLSNHKECMAMLMVANAKCTVDE